MIHWGDRYHARDLRTPREVRNAIVYVLMNAKKHGSRIATFAGFAVRIDASLYPCPVFSARTWLGGTGWRRRGLVRFDERPRVMRAVNGLAGAPP